MKKIRWGILSTAKIGREKVIPALQQSQLCEVIAIASRNKEQAVAVAEQLNIPKAYGSYEELLADDNVDAVYIPLPNHMHIDWSIRCLEAGKHILCEKPIGVSAEQAIQLLKASKRYPSLKIMEAFMYRFHPQWQYVKQAVDNGIAGEVKTVQSFFSYYNVDPGNIRNIKEAGGGGLMDIGCYCISIARFIFGKEPQRVMGCVEFDPVLKTDRLASGTLDFETATSNFTCSTQLTPYQRVNIVGTEARIEIEIPFNAPPDLPVRIWVHTKTGTETISFDPANQYSLQADFFSSAIIHDLAVPTPLEDAIGNMKVIEAVFESAAKGSWISPG